MQESKGKSAIGIFLKKHLFYAIAIGLAIMSLLFIFLYLLLSNLPSASQPASPLPSVTAGSGLTTKEGRRLAAEISSDFAPLPLDTDELFPPEEPDFLPTVLLYQEPRGEWSVEDAAPFWTDPSTLNVPALRSVAKERIDALMETIP